MKTLKYVLSVVFSFTLLAGSLALAAESQEPLYFSFEQRLMISYALLAQGEEASAKEAIFRRLVEQGLRNARAGIKEIQVENFEQFLELYRGEWPDTNSLELDLKLIEGRPARGLPVYVASSARVQRKIDKFIREQNQRLFVMAKAHSSESQAILASFPEQLPRLLQINEKMSTKLIALVSDLSEKLIETQIHELEHLGEKVGQSDMIGDKDPAAKIVLETLLNEYFGGLGMKSKKLLLSSFLGSNLVVPDLEKFELMVQNSGPQLQKFLQVVSRKGDLDPEMAAVFRKLESSVRPVPWVQVKELVEAEKNNFEFTYFERKPLGVGSMAQVHRAKIMIDGHRRDVVVRFIKPDIEERVMEDDRILKKIATLLDANPELRRLKFPKIAKMVEEITRTVTAELDQDATIQRQKLGKVAYERDIHLTTESGYAGILKIQVPDVIESKNKSRFMVQKLVFGRKLDKEYLQYQDEIPELKRVIVEKLASMWLEEALFGSGFYHADLHQGNFMLKMGEPSPVLTILDYGMSGVVSKDLPGKVLTLGTGFRALDAQAIAKGFWDISETKQNEVTFEEFKKLVDARVADIRKRNIPVPTMNEWLLWAIDRGLYPNSDFINLNRGNSIIASMLEEVGSSLTVDKITQKLILHNPNVVAKALLSHRNWKIQGLIKAALAPATPPKGTPVLRCEAVFLD